MSIKLTKQSHSTILYMESKLCMSKAPQDTTVRHGTCEQLNANENAANGLGESLEGSLFLALLVLGFGPFSF